MAERLPSASRLAATGSSAVLEEFATYRDRFVAITRRAPGRFEAGLWAEVGDDHRERLDLYPAAVEAALRHIADLLGERGEDRVVWGALKAVFSRVIDGRPDRELAETFFNSITRRVFRSVGVDPDVEFVDADADLHPSPRSRGVHRALEGDLARQVSAALTVTGFRSGAFGDRDAQADAAAGEIRLRLEAAGVDATLVALEVLTAPFFREQGAYVVGRIRTGDSLRPLPLVLCLRNETGGIRIDAVLTDERDVSVLFSFTRSHFMVETDSVYELVRFLKSLMPRKRIAELYVAVGEHKHGKTELYRDLLDRLRAADARFEVAPGTPGLVMVVFTIPGYDLVIKVIKDRFPPQKQMTRRRVLDRYELVFRHDRAGRMVEAHEFEYLEFDLAQFDTDLLDLLRREAGRTVQVVGEMVVVGHAYVERRVEPLDLFLRAAADEDGHRALADYAAAIRQLAQTDVFCGDILPKNFGVTRSGRVVFYDYDELAPVSEMRFRTIPPPPSDAEALSAEPWYGVGHNDVFPEEWPGFLGLAPAQRAHLEERHGEIFDAAFWRLTQGQLESGTPFEVIPYRDEVRLPVSVAGQQPSSQVQA